MRTALFRTPDPLDFESFLVTTYPNGHPGISIDELRSQWLNWCHRQGLKSPSWTWLRWACWHSPRTRTQPGQPRCIQAQLWSIDPAETDEQTRQQVWQTTLEQVAAQACGTTMLAQRQARLTELSPHRAVLRVQVRWLAVLARQSEPIRQALRRICHAPQLELELRSEESLHG